MADNTTSKFLGSKRLLREPDAACAHRASRMDIRGNECALCATGSRSGLSEVGGGDVAGDLHHLVDAGFQLGVADPHAVTLSPIMSLTVMIASA
ncbi:MAG: hypothetical protein R2713_20555 [Ilumatobacteraceae bacterium]